MLAFRSLFEQRRKILFIVSVAILIPLILYVFFSKRTERTPGGQQLVFPTPIPRSDFNLPRDSKVIIGKTTEKEVQQIPGIKKTKQEGPLATYEYPSAITSRPNQIQTENGIASFERTLTLSGNSSTTTIIGLKRKHGEPDGTLKGSVYYGPHVTWFIYANKGLAFIGNEFTDEVFEVLFFEPTTFEEFLKKYPPDVPREGVGAEQY